MESWTRLRQRRPVSSVLRCLGTFWGVALCVWGGLIISEHWGGRPLQRWAPAAFEVPSTTLFCTRSDADCRKVNASWIASHSAAWYAVRRASTPKTYKWFETAAQHQVLPPESRAAASAGKLQPPDLQTATISMEDVTTVIIMPRDTHSADNVADGLASIRQLFPRIRIIVGSAMRQNSTSGPSSSTVPNWVEHANTELVLLPEDTGLAFGR